MVFDEIKVWLGRGGCEVRYMIEGAKNLIKMVLRKNSEIIEFDEKLIEK